MNRRKSPSFYWLFLEPDVHVSFKKSHIFLYHTLSGKSLEYFNRPDLVRIIRRLQSESNLLVTRISYKYLQKHPEISRFIKLIRRYFMGDLLDGAFSNIKPIQFMPILNVRQDRVKVKKGASRSVGEEVMTHLFEISLYINSIGELVSPILLNAYRQFLLPHVLESDSSQLKLEQIQKVFEETSGGSLRRINILGGNIFKYPRFGDLVSWLNRTAFLKVYYFHYLYLKEGSYFLDRFRESKNMLKISVTFPLAIDRLKVVMELLQQAGINTKWQIVIENDRDMAQAMDIIDELQLESTSLQPYYNGKNFSFFKKNVFLNKKMILDSRPTLKEILTRKTINSNYFGRIVIKSNGSIYANVNMPRLGKLGKDSFYDMLYREASGEKSWRRIRSKVDPCRHCVFEYLCPPLSNYEFVIGRNNLCTLWKQRDG